MWLGVEPSTVAAEGADVRDLAARVGAVDPGSIGALLTAGMPDTASAPLAVDLSDRLVRELSALAQDLAAHADRLACAAQEYATAERALAHEIGNGR